MIAKELKSSRAKELPKGFSLLELLVYMAILGFIVLGVAAIFIAIQGGGARSQVQSEVNSNLRYAVEKVEDDLRSATAISAPISTNGSSSVLIMTTASGTITYCVASSTLYRSTSYLGGVNSWKNTTALPAIRTAFPPTVNNGYVYAVGGLDSLTTDTSSVLYAPINATGSLGAWSAATTLPVGRAIHSSVVYNGYVYAIGGDDGALAVTSSVLFAQINATGSLGAWTAATSLPAARNYHSSAVYNGYLYVVGGNGPTGTATTSVFYASINATGSLGAWTAATSLPAALASQSSIIVGGYLYVIGGNDAANVSTSSVLGAPINATGSLGAWSVSSPLPTAKKLFGSVMDGGYAYSIGGTDNTVATTSVFDAPFTTGIWSTVTTLPVARFFFPSILNNGYIYVLGGALDATTGTSSVLYASIICGGDAITDGTVLVNSATFTRFQNTNSVLNDVAVSVQTDIGISYNGTGAEEQYSQEKITTTALRNF